jgi:hypothetical protein
MSIDITSYETLLMTARQQPDAQKLLFVFLKAALPHGHTPEEAQRFGEGRGGALAPVFCVGLAPDQLTTFADLVTEADAMGPEWQIVLVAALGGTDSEPPSDEKVDEWLGMMQQTVQGGGDLSQFIAFNRDGEPVFFG